MSRESMMAKHGLTEDDFKPKEKEKTNEEQIKQLQEQNRMLIECILELADIIYA